MTSAPNVSTAVKSDTWHETVPPPAKVPRVFSVEKWVMSFGRVPIDAHRHRIDEQQQQQVQRQIRIWPPCTRNTPRNDWQRPWAFAPMPTKKARPLTLRDKRKKRNVSDKHKHDKKKRHDGNKNDVTLARHGGKHERIAGKTEKNDDVDVVVLL